MMHIGLHFFVPALLVGLCFRKDWKQAYFIMMATMLVDMDHLLANPIYDPGRCSIGFHPLHQLWFITLYLALCFIPKTRLVGLGLSIHMALDAIDCQVTNGTWINSSIIL
jgi:hypothetical protein